LAVVQPRDIDESGALDTRKVEYVDLSLVKPSQLLNTGDVLLVGRGRICATVYRDELKPHCIASGALFVLRPKSGAPITSDFLTIYLNSHDGQLAIARLGSRTTATFLNRANLDQLEIPVPEPSIQQSLAALNNTKKRFLDLSARKAAIIDRVIGHEFKFNKQDQAV
jgi:restriction endonuclease S subunit